MACSHHGCNLKPWLNEHEAIIDYSDTACAPCKDFYHIFVTENEIIFRWWKIVPPTRADSGAPPSEIKNSYDDFLHDERVHSEIQRLCGDNTLTFLIRIAEGQFDFLMHLPDHLLKKILLSLDLEDMIRLSATCRKFRHLADDEDVWEKIFRRTVETPVTAELESLAAKEGWKRLFYTNKLQLQMQLRRQKREEHGHQHEQQEYGQQHEGHGHQHQHEGHGHHHDQQHALEQAMQQQSI